MRRISRRDLLGLGAAAGVVAVSGAPAHALPERGGSLRLGLAGRGIGRLRRAAAVRSDHAGRGPRRGLRLPDGDRRGRRDPGRAGHRLGGEPGRAGLDLPAARGRRLPRRAALRRGRRGGDAAAAHGRRRRGGRGADRAGAADGPHEVQVVAAGGDAGPAVPAGRSAARHAARPCARAGDGRGDRHRALPDGAGADAERAVLRRVERHWKDGRRAGSTGWRCCGSPIRGRGSRR
jgi:hypothetical protein